jgi:hypothetical protein
MPIRGQSFRRSGLARYAYGASAPEFLLFAREASQNKPRSALPAFTTVGQVVRPGSFRRSSTFLVERKAVLP